MFNTTGVIGRNSKSLRYPGKSGTIAKYLRSTGSLPLLNHCSTMIVCGNQGRFGKLHSSITDSFSSTVATITTMSSFLTDAVGFLVTGIVNLWCFFCRCCVGGGDGDLRSSEDFLGVDRCCVGGGDGDLRSSEDFLGVDLLVYKSIHHQMLNAWCPLCILV